MAGNQPGHGMSFDDGTPERSIHSLYSLYQEDAAGQSLPGLRPPIVLA